MSTIKKARLFLPVLVMSLMLGCSESLTHTFDGTQEEAVGILGGTAVEAESAEARHLAMLVDLETNQICTATLVRRDVLLTAAHCLPSRPDLLSVFFDPNPLSDDSSVLPSSVRKTVVHSLYTKKADAASVDLALIFLNESAPAEYRVASLPGSASLQAHAAIEMTGYGRQSLEDLNSFGRLNRVRGRILSLNKGFFEVDQSQGLGVCDGDSGGAAFVGDGEVLTLVGVTKMAYDKYAQGQDTCLGVSQFTRVDKNLSWILENL